MKHGSTLFLKIAVFLMGVSVLALSILLLVDVVKNPANPDYAHILYPIVIGLFTSVIPFFVALYQAFKLLNYIDRNEAFSERSVKHLKNIKVCAIIIGSLYTVILPFVFLLAQLDDAPGLVIVGMVPIFASIVIAVFAAVLQKLLQEAINFKIENDLTV
ncbi:DUF2975 domain-containing protein [Lederbergia graminis]|uniref:DUF2975 domain-containing protein n=1 Tax=Lederbergia graminis TaxID=735518 RepID=A0ABW0LEA6_9BACI